jgi:hypothetical protein
MTLNGEHTQKIVYIVTQFRRLSEIDTYTGKYYGQFYIESKWIEPELIDVYQPDKHWNPKLHIENSFPDVSEKISFKVVKNEKTTTITEKRYVKGKFCYKYEKELFSFINMLS